MKVTEVETLEFYSPDGTFLFGIGMLRVRRLPFINVKHHIISKPGSALRKVIEDIKRKQKERDK